MDVDVAVLTLVCLAPDGAQQPALRDDPPGMGEENPQDLELAWGQVHGVGADPDLMTGGVEDERPDRQPPVLIGRRTRGVAKRDPKTGIELVDPERLGDVVVGTTIERFDLLLLLVPTGQDDDRCPRLAPDPADELQPVHVRQAEVEQDHIRAARRPALEGRLAVGRLAGPVTPPRQLADDHRASLVVVLDDQDDRSVGVRWLDHPAPAVAAEGCAAGRSRSTASPPSSLARAVTRPPIVSTSPRTTARPMPVPDRDPRSRPGTR